MYLKVKHIWAIMILVKEGISTTHIFGMFREHKVTCMK